LAPLARVRQIREDAARAEYAARARAHTAAAREAREREQALEAYRIWRVKEENRRYQAVLHQSLGRKELEAFKEGIAALRDRDAVLRAEAERAREAEKDAALARDKAAEAVKRARGDKEKISEHRDRWRMGELREAERAEDLEMEEFSAPKQPGWE
jgi:type III secretion protein O